MLPSMIQMILYGLIVSSCKVKTHNINESAMDHLVSKSNTKQDLSLFEKEQRVDGSCRIKIIRLRNTLMGFERSYKIQTPSNLFSNINIHNKAMINSIDPLFVSGFT
jgi:hypothetical protein